MDQNPLETTTPQKESLFKNPTTMGAFALLIVLFIGLGVWWYFGMWMNKRPSYTFTNTPQKALLEDNTSFSEAEALFKNGQYDLAKAKYQEALLSANDSVLWGQINFKIALTTEKSGDYSLAIRLFKDVAANQRNNDFVRAYAVQELGKLLLNSDTVKYRDEVFSGEPYAAMTKDADTAVANRRLFEYASLFHPLALSDLYTANWYASELLRDPVESATTTQWYLDVVRSKLLNADADIARLKKDPNEMSGVPEALKRQAIVLGKLVRLGQATSAQAEAAFIEAMNVNAALGPGNDGYVRYYFAQYLSSFGEERIADLRTILAPFYMTGDYESSSVINFFKGERRNLLNQKATFKGLARKDPKFKDFLTTLGWKGGDF